MEGDICRKGDYDKLKERFNKNEKNDKNGGQKIGTLINCAALDKAAILAPLIAYNREGARVVPIAADAAYTNAVLLSLGFRLPLPGGSYFKLIFGNLKKLGFFGG